MQAIEYDFSDKINRVGYLCPSKLLPGCSCNGGEVDCWIFCKGREVSGVSTVGWIGAWIF